MTDWTPTQLSAIADAYQLEIASRRRDGSLSPRVTIWAVGVDEDIYVRSVNGPKATWFRNTQARPTGRIWSGGVEHDVAFQTPGQDAEMKARIDEAYCQKFGAGSLATQRIIAPLARQTTLRLTPIDPA